MSCIKCGKEAFITFSNDEYCINCFNKLINADDNIELPIKYSTKDNKGNEYKFEIEYIYLPTLIRFTTNNEDFKIEKGYPIEADLMESLDDFIIYINKVINTNTIKNDNTIKEKGSIIIGFESFIIDNKELAPLELYKLFSCYEGYHIDYRIMDSSNEIITKDDYLCKYTFNNMDLLNEYYYIKDLFNNILFTDNNFNICKYIFDNYLAKLKGYFNIEPYNASIIVKNILDDIEANPLCFNNYSVKLINKIEKDFYLYSLFLNNNE